MDIIESVFVRNNLVMAFALIGATIWVSYFLADRLTGGRIHGSAIAISLGLIAAWARLGLQVEHDLAVVGDPLAVADNEPASAAAARRLPDLVPRRVDLHVHHMVAAPGIEGNLDVEVDPLDVHDAVLPHVLEVFDDEHPVDDLVSQAHGL